MSILVGSMASGIRQLSAVLRTDQWKESQRLSAYRISLSMVPTAIFLGCLIKLHAATLKQMRRFKHHTMSSK